MSYALPDYLARRAHFGDCPPGHRFGLYFDGWEADWRKPTNKTPAFKTVADAFPAHSRSALGALRARQQSLADDLGDAVLSYPARLSAPLATSLGNEHPLENGFAFLNPHGLPYLAGSGVKGVLRRAAEELASGEWGETAGWCQPAIDTLFGLETDSGDTGSVRTRGALAFWDLFFEPPAKKKALTVEIMTPHHSGYLQGSGSPHANESPNPIPFLAVPAESGCTLYVQCDPALIPAAAEALRDGWKTLIEAAIEHAGEWLGFGGKAAVGYGRIAQDRVVVEKFRRDAEARRTSEAARLHAQHEAARIAALPAWQQTREDVLKCKPADQKGEDALLKALEAGRWPDAAEARAIAVEIADALKESKQWREKSEKKNPDKDQPFQKTRRVKRFLG